MSRNSKGFVLIVLILIVAGILGALFVWNVVKTPLSIKTPIVTTSENLPTPSPTVSANVCQKDPLVSFSQAEKEIIGEFSTTELEVGVSKVMNNYAVIGEHGVEPNYHGGDWCVVKKECGKWTKVFCSQDQVYCESEDYYHLPKGLLAPCATISPNTSQ